MSMIRAVHTECLKGEVDIQGSKNAVLPMLAASILNKGRTVITGCPDIADVRNTIEILNYIGCKTSFSNGTVEIDATNIEKKCIPDELAGRLRSVVVFVGALIARKKEAKVFHPGGCSIGKRPVDIHINALSKMNIHIVEEGRLIYGKTVQIQGNHVRLKFPSVGATQNVLLCAVLAKGRTVIENYAREPEIIEFCSFLNNMGANIKVMQKSIQVLGVKQFHDSEFELCGDRIVAGTYLFATAITGGSVMLNHINPGHLTMVLRLLVNAGCEIYIEADRIRIERSRLEKIKGLGYVETLPYPGFPTDLQAFMTVLMSCAEGSTILKENIFENRLNTAKQLLNMGADIHILSDSLVKITGVEQLKGAGVKASDLRDGAALVVAGLAAKGETVIYDPGFIYRGYEDIVGDLKLLGANIQQGDVIPDGK